MYVWRVWKNNRFAGYVSSPSQFDAFLKARAKFGQNIWVERIEEYRVVYHPNDTDHFVEDSQSV